MTILLGGYNDDSPNGLAPVDDCSDVQNGPVPTEV